MKAILITYNQAYYDDVVAVLNRNGVKGYTEWDEIKGHGSDTGEPHLGSHAWPTQNHAIFTVVENELAPKVMDLLRKTDRDNPKLGLRAYVLPVEDAL